MDEIGFAKDVETKLSRRPWEVFRLLSPILFFTVLFAIFFVTLAASNHITLTVCLGAFAFFYMLSLFFGILDLIAKIAGDPNSDTFRRSIFKVVEKSPFLLPTTLFAFLIVLATTVLSSNMIGYFFYFSLFFLLSMLLYFAQLLLVRNRFERHLRAIDQVEKKTRHLRQFRAPDIRR
jgi:hypothetical protein